MDKDKFQKLLDKTYRFLAVRPRSEKEVANYLQKKKALVEQVEKIFSLLKQQDLINDSAFAQWWIEQRATFRPRGKRALKMELRQKGIAQDLIDQELAENFDELSQAQKAIQKKLKIYSGLPYLERKVKLSAFLARNGFSWEIIKQVINNVNNKN